MFKSLLKNFSKHEREKRKFINAQEELIERLKTEIEVLEKAIQQTENTEEVNPKGFLVMNGLLFFRLSFLEIVVVLKLLLQSANEDEKLVLSKQLCSSIYEFLSDIPEVFGKDYNAAIAQLNFTDAALEDYKQIKISISKLKKEVLDELKMIRHFTAAHKEHNSLKQLNVIHQISSARVILISLAIHALYIQFHKFELHIRKWAKEKAKI